MDLEPAIRDEWYVVGATAACREAPLRTRLLGTDIVVSGGDPVSARTASGRDLPVRLRYGCVWVSLGAPEAEPPAIPEADEDDRRHVLCGAVGLRASGLRIVENFLDMAHFPFVHTDILGAEPHTEVMHYTTEIRRDVDEVWATNCRFFQPQAALSAKGGIETQYQYRVATPHVTMLYKTCPNAANRWDVICLFVQPLDPDRCRAHPVMFLIDDASRLTDLVAFQQVIFLQDRIILENQRPVLLPLEPRAEIPTRADSSSVAYRRWLKEKGVRYGTTIGESSAAA
ncbi:aromatic ring-hydroxylating oxygenase subunit alpha [Methylorubrum thiocyanatum]|uniref:Phenylpropionate dioxygenase-like ring-hydroxylating dioxygenase large terminal subunit n=1 Tax=Methylorubrum thiocyanatum TaxID=47958 RepID=A0AA40S3F7_9HYPH|nr:aromatic ring-hydroxylating dioxygenase subunit alpha [Methylorubrum thiocyanatum]MBA8913871.1 phenylpropionate dioxygenase-like ring-hydroxylating dioxygenase large terminal subunit [Methylorubrum thiocyanatum]GJE83057.1 putative methylxanthine N7-demethylase NdmC [Methylorubrum thiocyanatum]